MSNSESSIALFLTPEHQCSYLPEETRAQTQFIDPGLTLSPGLYEQLLAAGFRRSGDHVYRPSCPECSECTPLRLRIADFKPKRNQRRCLKSNADLQVTISAKFTDEHYDLYQRYLIVRHADGSMAQSTRQESEAFLLTSWCPGSLIEFRLEKQLLGVAVTDVLPNSLSAVYTFFDPAYPSRSLGVFGILRQIELARTLNLTYLYLGYWIPECGKMSYKADYQPSEFLKNSCWKKFPGC